MSQFHAKDGWTFERLTGGEVRIIVRENREGGGTLASVVLDAGTWASVMASVSALGEDAYTFGVAWHFHEGQPMEDRQ